MNSSTLSRLPPELRERIFELVVDLPRPLTIQLSTSNLQLSQPKDSSLLALAQTCSQLRHESLPIFFRSNTFVLHIDNTRTGDRSCRCGPTWLSNLHRWLHTISPPTRRLLGDVDIQLEVLDINDCRTAERAWSDVESAWGLFDRGVRLSLSLKIIDYFQERHAELKLPLLDPKDANMAITRFCRAFEVCLVSVLSLRMMRWERRG